MGLFSRKSKIDPEELNTLRAEVMVMRARLEATENARQGFEHHLEALDVTTSALTERTRDLDEATMRMAEVDVLKRQVAQLDVINAKITSLDALNGKIAELSDRVTDSSDTARSAREQTVILHERIASVSAQVVNQLSELGQELDQLATLQSEAAAANNAATNSIDGAQAVDDGVLDQIRAAQVKLAQEQARYEIAFRQDLAMLAEQMMRGRGS